MLPMQNHEKLISVIVPIYQVENYLARCIDSILSQSYKNIEVILVDDGSPDRCGAICDEYKAKDSRVIVIHKHNGGLSDARNAGIDIATGEFITFLDSDDWLHRDFLKLLYNLIAESDSDIAICNHLVTSNVVNDAPARLTSYSVYEESNIEPLLWAVVDPSIALHGALVVAWGKLYKRELILDIRFPYGKFHEDAFFTHQLLCSAKRVVFTDLPLVYYFQRDDSINGVGFNIRKRLDLLEAYDQRAIYYRQRGYAKLSSHCDKLYFLRAFNLDKEMDNFADKTRILEFKRTRESLKYSLRQGKFGLRFRLFVELYYLSPRLFLMLHQRLK